MPSPRSARLQALYLARPESFVEQLLQGLLPAEHPDVYHLPVLKEHRLGDIMANSVTDGVGAGLALIIEFLAERKRRIMVLHAAPPSDEEPRAVSVYRATLSAPRRGLESPRP